MPIWRQRWLHPSGAQATTDQMEQSPPTGAAPSTRLRVFAVALAVLAAMVAGLWLDTRGRIGATQDELAKRLRDIETESREARPLGRQTQEAPREVPAKLGALDA